MNDQITEYMLRSIETAERRQYLSNIVFRAIFFLLVIIEVFFYFFLRYLREIDPSNFFLSDSSKYFYFFGMAGAIIFMYWTISIISNQVKIEELRKAIASANSEGGRIFEFFEISNTYSYSVHLGVLRWYTRTEPYFWFVMCIYLAVVAFLLNVE